ncbi:hypothetical protein FVE85_4866 [Porphyridium purpureum]|uniref:Uncharacterized protein n=1 Tax=Porphyridium purpureum TaxID=35688 RepID=A0A5J4YQJ4_PORPP|nr:hypothetical protein FVE85_4866 [Porphyridium purpureum]|eukprot:POR7589..scf236_6
MELGIFDERFDEQLLRLHEQVQLMQAADERVRSVRATGATVSSAMRSSGAGLDHDVFAVHACRRSLLQKDETRTLEWLRILYGTRPPVSRSSSAAATRGRARANRANYARTESDVRQQQQQQQQQLQLDAVVMINPLAEVDMLRGKFCIKVPHLRIPWARALAEALWNQLNVSLEKYDVPRRFEGLLVSEPCVTLDQCPATVGCLLCSICPRCAAPNAQSRLHDCACSCPLYEALNIEALEYNAAVLRGITRSKGQLPASRLCGTVKRQFLRGIARRCTMGMACAQNEYTRFSMEYDKHRRAVENIKTTCEPSILLLCRRKEVQISFDDASLLVPGEESPSDFTDCVCSESCRNWKPSSHTLTVCAVDTSANASRRPSLYIKAQLLPPAAAPSNVLLGGGGAKCLINGSLLDMDCLDILRGILYRLFHIDVMLDNTGAMAGPSLSASHCAGRSLKVAYNSDEVDSYLESRFLLRWSQMFPLAAELAKMQRVLVILKELERHIQRYQLCHREISNLNEELTRAAIYYERLNARSLLELAALEVAIQRQPNADLSDLEGLLPPDVISVVRQKSDILQASKLVA